MSAHFDEESTSLLGKSSTNAVAEEPKRNIFAWSSVVLVLTGILSVGFMVASNSRPKMSTTELLGTPRIYFGSFGDDEIANLWKDYKIQFSKQYDPEVESMKFENFKKFLARCDERNQAEELNGGTAKHGLTKFSDMSEDEFSKYYLGFRPLDEIMSRQASAEGIYGSLSPNIWDNSSVAGQDYNTSYVDWARKLTTTVNNQGFCGSCWAFSTVEQIESDAIRAGLLDRDEKLSYQQVVSCDHTDWGCDGGFTGKAYEFVNHVGGLVSNDEYPYDSRGGMTHQCNHTLSSTDRLITVDSYYEVASETDMMTYVLSTGPLSVCLDALSWSSYTGGIVTSCGDAIDHCVQVVGLNADENYWIVRNSWGTDWGEHGYIYLEAGVNMCGIATIPTFAVVSKASS